MTALTTESITQQESHAPFEVEPHYGKSQTNPVNPNWVLFDLLNAKHPRPMKGQSYLVINPGGVLGISPIYKGVRYWAYKPDVPEDPAPEDQLKYTLFD